MSWHSVQCVHENQFEESGQVENQRNGMPKNYL